MPTPPPCQADQQQALLPHFSKEERCMKVAFERVRRLVAPRFCWGSGHKCCTGAARHGRSNAAPHTEL